MKKIAALLIFISSACGAQQIASTNATGPAGSVIGYNAAGHNWLYVPVDTNGYLLVDCPDCAAGGPPTGAASNGLTGTYPGPGLSSTAVVGGVAGQAITPSGITQNEILVDGQPSSGTCGGVAVTTQLDCAWAKAVSGLATQSQRLKFGLGNYVTMLGLSMPSSTSTGNSISLIGANKSFSGNTFGTEITLGATLSSPVLNYPYLSTSSGQQYWYNVYITNLTVNAAGLAPMCLDAEAPAISVFRAIECHNAIGSRAHIRIGGYSNANTSAPGSNSTIAPVNNAGLVPSGFNGGGFQDVIDDVFDIKDGATGPGATVTGAVSGGGITLTIATGSDPANNYNTFDGINTRPVIIKGSVAGQIPCTTMGVMTGNIVSNKLVSFNTVTPYSGCTGTVNVAVPDMAMATYSFEVGVTDSTISNLVCNGSGMFCLNTRGATAITITDMHPTNTGYGVTSWGGIQFSGRGECDSLYVECFSRYFYDSNVPTNVNGFYSYNGGAFPSSIAYDISRTYDAVGNYPNLTIGGQSITSNDANGNPTGKTISPDILLASTSISTPLLSAPPSGTDLIVEAAGTGHNVYFGDAGGIWAGINSTTFYPTSNGAVGLGSSGFQWGPSFFTSISLSASQALTSVQGTAGTKLAAASGAFTNGNLRSTNSTGDEVDSGVATSTVSRVSNAITSATAGSGISAVTCTTAACTNLRGTYTMTATTVSAGATILTLVWPTTTTAYVCLVSQDGGTLAIAPSHSVATATGMAIVSDLAITSGSIGIDYSCQP